METAEIFFISDSQTAVTAHPPGRKNIRCWEMKMVNLYQETDFFPKVPANSFEIYPQNAVKSLS